MNNTHPHPSCVHLKATYQTPNTSESWQTARHSPSPKALKRGTEEQVVYQESPTPPNGSDAISRRRVSVLPSALLRCMKQPKGKKLLLKQPFQFDS